MQAKLQKSDFIDCEFYKLFLQCTKKRRKKKKEVTKLNINNLNINSLSNKSDILINHVVECVSIPIHFKSTPACIFLHTLYHL